MKSIDIIVMGKTGAGKSTLINAVLGEEVASTGKGQAVTKTNTIYSKKMPLPVQINEDGGFDMVDYKLNMYDTVGLEIDETITDKTLQDICEHIEDAKQKAKFYDKYVVWFCINERSNRFEEYELSLIKKLSVEYEIPFIIVLTQCISEEENTIEQKIRESLNEVRVGHVLAKDYVTRYGTIPAYGIIDLLRISVNEYKTLKVKIIERKLLELGEKRKERIHNMELQGMQLVEKYSSSAGKIGIVPGGCIPVVHGICIKMISNLNHVMGFKDGKAFAKEVLENIVAGAMLTPLMMVPVFSAAIASSYIRTIGDSYLKILLEVVNFSSDQEIENSTLMESRLKAELKKLKK